MYKIFVISYSGSHSDAVKEIVKSFGAWFNHFDNQYLVCTTMSMKEIKVKLDNRIALGSDKLLILKVNLEDEQGWLNDSGWAWIKSQKLKLAQIS